MQQHQLQQMAKAVAMATSSSDNGDSGSDGPTEMAMAVATNSSGNGDSRWIRSKGSRWQRMQKRLQQVATTMAMEIRGRLDGCVDSSGNGPKREYCGPCIFAES